jgi:hypothetical protein
MRKKCSLNINPCFFRAKLLQFAFFYCETFLAGSIFCLFLRLRLLLHLMTKALIPRKKTIKPEKFSNLLKEKKLEQKIVESNRVTQNCRYIDSIY